VRDLIGIGISNAEIDAIFKALEMTVTGSGDHACAVGIPSWRGDLEREVDLIEEVARIHGLDQIPTPAPHAELVPDADDTAIRRTSQLRGRLVGLGLREIMNYTYLSPQLLNLFTLDRPDERVVLPNPLSQDQSVLRTSLLPQVVESLGRNANRQIRRAAFFEIGRTYHRGGDGTHRETSRVAVGLLGPVGRQGIDLRSPVGAEEMFLAVKGIWEALAGNQQVAGWSLEAGTIPGLRAGYATWIQVDGKPVGRLGLLQRTIAREWRITEPVGVFEVEAGVLIAADTARVRVQPVPVYPATARDLALVVDTAVTHRQVRDIVQSVSPKELENVELFDIFTGEGIGAGKKSLAYSFTYRSGERTLTDEQANRLHDEITDALLSGLKAEIRS
jgi:phenylalanyl-tRNA synthetase beta chain